ncbi:kinase-like domain-containing protein, partial [Pelagophyceae sp. CCMP2097]
EASALAKLHHPNIVAFYGVVLHAQHAFIVTEFVSTSLDAHVYTHRARGLPVRDYGALALGIARGLAFLHARGTAHRDVKPSNVLVAPRNVAKLCDFGLSRNDDAAMNTCTAGVGTPAPPRRQRMALTDSFSFSMLLVAMWTTFPPFADTDSPNAPQAFTVMSKIAAGERPAVPQGMPPALADVVRTCWSQRPEAR